MILSHLSKKFPAKIKTYCYMQLNKNIVLKYSF